MESRDFAALTIPTTATVVPGTENDEHPMYSLTLAEIAESVSETDEPDLIQCAQEGCTHTFYFVEGRQFPRLCMDHAELFKNIAIIGGRL